MLLAWEFLFELEDTYNIWTVLPNLKRKRDQKHREETYNLSGRKLLFPQEEGQGRTFLIAHRYISSSPSADIDPGS